MQIELKSLNDNIKSEHISLAGFEVIKSNDGLLKFLYFYRKASDSKHLLFYI